MFIMTPFWKKKLYSGSCVQTTFCIALFYKMLPKITLSSALVKDRMSLWSWKWDSQNSAFMMRQAETNKMAIQTFHGKSVPQGMWLIIINTEAAVCSPLSRGNLFSQFVVAVSLTLVVFIFIPCCGCLIFPLENYFSFNETFCSVYL